MNHRGDVLFILDPLASIHPYSDSSYVMITEALNQGYRVWTAELSGLLLRESTAYVHARLAAPDPHSAEPSPPLIFTSDWQLHPAKHFSLILMRKDPPVDENFMIATWWLDRALKETPVVNHPVGLRDLNEKLSILHFPQLIPKTFLLRSKHDLRAVLSELGGQMILKPVYGYGGRGVLRAHQDDPNLNTLFELATQEEHQWTIAQEVVPEAARGDKRILLIHGEPVGAVLRVPAKGEIRNNFHTGGQPVATELTPHEREICSHIGAFLREHGQFFAGIDILGAYLSEINITSPTGMQEINRLGNLTEEKTMQAIFWSTLQRVFNI